MAKKDLSDFIEQAKSSSKLITPKQKVVPVKENKRDNETAFTLWVDKNLMRKYKLKAVNENTNVKELIVKAMIKNIDF